MTLEILSLDDITNYGATTHAEYAIIMLRRSQQAGDTTGRTAMINVSVRDEQGLESYHKPDGELTVRDGTRWVSIICGGISAGRVGEWLLVRGSPPPENPKYVLNPERVAEAEAAFTRMRAGKRNDDEDMVPTAKHHAISDESQSGPKVPVRSDAVSQATPMVVGEAVAILTADAERQTEPRATRIVMTLAQLVALRRDRNENDASSRADSTGDRPAIYQQKFEFSPVYTAAETQPLLLSRLPYSRAKLLADANILAQKIRDSLAEIRRLNGEIELHRSTIQRLWRASAQWNNYSVEKLMDKIDQLVPQRDGVLIETQVWVHEKQDLDRKIAELVEASAPSR